MDCETIKDEKEEVCDESVVQESGTVEVADSKPQDKSSEDLFLYTRLNDFTSEIYKIEIGNLPNFVGYGQLRKLLSSTLKLNPCKVKGIGAPMQFAFVTFRNEDDKVNAMNILDGYKWKGKALTVKIAKPAADPMAKKRKAEDSCPDRKKARDEEDDLPVEIRLKNAVTPFWNIPYEEQLQKKEKDVCEFLKKLAKDIEKVNHSLRPVLQKYRNNNSQQCCPLSSIIPSPITSAYRNKCEFTSGLHFQTQEKTVGFRLTSYKKGSMSVAEPDECINISNQMLKAVKSFEAYIRDSNLDVYNPETHEGYWRQLTVRTSNNEDVLLIIVMHPQTLSQDELETEKTKLIKYYTEGNGSLCGITSVYFQLFAKKASHEETVVLDHLMGKKHLEETLLGMKFQVSPEAFFQINVPATEVLYSLIADIVKSTGKSDSVIDVCCGTGTISLCLAKAGAKVVGIEMCPEAVDNARLNASANNLPDAEFICGKAEDTILSAISNCEGEEIVAVVDPPRAGLHQKVLKVIRDCSKIQKLIYISCNANSAYNNFVDLCRMTSNKYRGFPFYPTQCHVVDMFPHTPHKEIVFVFERCSDPNLFQT